MARASTRVSIRWPPAPASEPTDTLVLTVGVHYVDLRVKKEDGSIDWALAGETLLDPKYPGKVEFTHPLDSHHNPILYPGPPAPDVGYFSPLPNGDDLETGEMANPDAGGKVMAYEEIWRELDWATTGSSSSVKGWILESQDVEAEGSAEQQRRKTFYAKLGRYFLAVERAIHGGEEVGFAALRQDYDAAREKWVVKYEIGQAGGIWKFSGEDVDEASWKVGDAIKIGSGERQQICIVKAIE